MKTPRLVFLALMMLVLPLMAAATAQGKPPAPQDPRGGYTCAETGVDQTSHGLMFTGTGFRFTLSGHRDLMCVDVPPSLADNAGNWVVSATTSGGRVGRLLLVPRDSYSPGDSCGGLDLRSPSLPLSVKLPYSIPAATVNACGTAFGEWLDSGLEMTKTGAPHPLVFVGSVEGTNPQVTIEVTVP